MKTVTETAIKVLIDRSTRDGKADDALKYTQAALNLAHTLQVMKQVEVTENKG